MYRKIHTSLLAITGSLVLLSASPTFAEIIVPEGGAGTALRLTDDLKPLGRITDLGNVHGMDVARSRGLLVSASLSEQASGQVKKPEAMSEESHAAHHKTGAKTPTGDVSIVSLIDIATGKVTRRIEVPGGVHHVTVGAKDRFALVTHPSLGAVSLIDLDAGQVTATIQTGPNPNYAVYDDTSGTFFVSNAGNATISQIDPVEGLVRRNLKTPGGIEHMAIDVEGRRLFGAEADDGRIDIVSLDTGEVTKTFDIGGDLHGIVWDQASDTVFFSARSRGQIGRINLTDDKTELFRVGPEPYHMALDGGRILVSSAEFDVVWSFDAATMKKLGEAETAARGHQMVVLP